MIIYMMAKKRMLDSLKRFDFVKNVLGEFNEEIVGNNLVLDIVDYKKTRRQAQELVARQDAVSPDATLNQSLSESTLQA